MERVACTAPSLGCEEGVGVHPVRSRRDAGVEEEVLCRGCDTGMQFFCYLECIILASNMEISWQGLVFPATSLFDLIIVDTRFAHEVSALSNVPSRYVRR